MLPSIFLNYIMPLHLNANPILRVVAYNDQPFPHRRSEAEAVRAANAARRERQVIRRHPPCFQPVNCYAHKTYFALSMVLKICFRIFGWRIFPL